MKICFEANAWEDYLFWQRSDKKMQKKINALIREICKQPFTGIGKPEALKYDLSGYWSRRINQEHRLVYRYDTATNIIVIMQCRYHY